MIGWKACSIFVVGDESMGTFMSETSALAYLHKGDSLNAMLILRDSAERNLLLAHRNGTYLLEYQYPGATRRWIIRYAELRKRLPASPSMSNEMAKFDAEVNALISEATKPGAGLAP